MNIIPSRNWFPQNLPARAAWFVNFKTQFLIVAASLGLDSYNGAVSNDSDVMQFLAQTVVELDAYKEAVRQYRIIITEKPTGEPTPQFPANPNFALPKVIDTGIFDRLKELVEKIRAASSYTDEIGALLGILPTQPTSITPDEIKPAIKVTAAFTDYKFTVHATRMGMSAYRVQIRRMESEVWTDAAFSQTSDCEVTVVPTVAGQPERLQVRVILLDKNQPVGQPSDPVYVTVNP